MKKRIIFASELIKNRDDYHLALELYRFIHRHPKLLQQKLWKQIEQITEEFVIEAKLIRSFNKDMTKEEILYSFRIITELECKYNNKIFIFGPRTVWRFKNKKRVSCKISNVLFKKMFKFH